MEAAITRYLDTLMLMNRRHGILDLGPPHLACRFQNDMWGNIKAAFQRTVMSMVAGSLNSKGASLVG